MTQRLIQISDCHIENHADSLQRGVNTHQRLCAAIQHSQRAHPKHILTLLTGDISQTGIPESYQCVLDAFKQQSYSKPIYALPGNHDNALEMRETMRGTIHCTHSVALNSWQILLLDSSVIDEVHGHITQQDLQWLTQWLEQTTATHTLVALHHPPVSVNNAWMDEVGVNNGSALMNLLADYPHVKGVLFGHVHHASEQQCKHIKVLGCPSTAYRFDPSCDEFTVDIDVMPSYRWIDLHSNGTLETGISQLKSI